MNKKTIILVLLILLLTSAAYSRSFTNPVKGTSNIDPYDKQGNFYFLNAQTFGAQSNPTISVSCDRENVNWPNGCPGPDQTLVIDPEDPDTYVDTDEVHFEFCGQEVPAEIMDDASMSQDGVSSREYRAKLDGENFEDKRLYDICDFVFGVHKPVKFVTNPDNYGAKCGVLRDTVCAKQGGQVIISRLASPNLGVILNREATGVGGIGGSDGSEGDLNGFRLTNTNDGNGNVHLEEYDTSRSNDVDVKEFKTNYVLSPTSGNINDGLVNPYDPNSCQKDKPCRVATAPFTDNTAEINTRMCAEKKHGLCALGYDFENRLYYYTPNGEVVLGWEYDNEKPGKIENKVFNFCTPNVKASHGKTMYSPGDNYEYDQFKCTSSGEWKNVAVCNDGQDNDGDGAIDMNDPGCESPSDNSEAGSIGCKANITQQYVDSNGNLATASTGSLKKVVTDWDKNGNQCEIASIDPDLDYTSHNPQVFTCRQDPTQTQIDSETYPYATDLAGVADFNAADTYCANLPDSAFSGHSDTVKAAQSFASKSAIPLSSQDEEAAKRYIKEVSDDEYRFKNMFFQTLHSAETGYAPTCTEVFGSGGACGPVFDHEHDAQTWEFLSMQDTSEGYNPDEYIDSWVVSNVSANNSEVYSHDPTTASNKAFPGGFAGKCSSPLKWINNGLGWKCGIPSDNVLITADFYTHSYKGSGPHYAGFRINWSEIKEWEDAYNAPPEGNSNFGPVQVRAQCWLGGANQRPGTSERANINANVQEGKPVIISKKLSESAEDSTPYTCIFGLRQKVKNPSASSKNGEEFDTDGDGTHYFYAGSNDDRTGPVNFDVETISVETSFLENNLVGQKSGVTDLGSTNPFKDFYEGGTSSRTQKSRNPCIVAGYSDC